MAGKAAREGHTMAGIAKSLGVGKKKLYQWMKEHPDFEKAVNDGRDFFDTRVAEDCLKKLAKGTKITKKKKIIRPDGSVEYSEETSRALPNVTALIFWLKNRQPERWRDVHNLEVEGGEGLEARLRSAMERVNNDKEGDRRGDTGEN